MVLAWRRARGKAVGRNRIARSGQDSIGRVAADWEAGSDDAGNSKCCSCGDELVAVCSEACTVAGGKSINETAKSQEQGSSKGLRDFDSSFHRLVPASHLPEIFLPPTKHLNIVTRRTSTVDSTYQCGRARGRSESLVSIHE